MQGNIAVGRELPGLQPAALRSLPVIRNINVRGSRRRCIVIVNSRGNNPYEPIERAIQVINRVISVGEKSGWSSNVSNNNEIGDDTSNAGSNKPQRWVQFGAVSSSTLEIAEPNPSVPNTTSTTTTGSVSSFNSSSSSSSNVNNTDLRQYLSLPVDQYSLLDPKWISKEPDGTSFRFCIPMNELIGVDLRPEVFITPHPDPATGRVTLVGTRAALGSPDIDSAFKLNIVAVVGPKVQRKLPSYMDPRNIPRPSHLPGRPVTRFKNWWAGKKENREQQDANSSFSSLSNETVQQAQQQNGATTSKRKFDYKSMPGPTWRGSTDSDDDEDKEEDLTNDATIVQLKRKQEEQGKDSSDSETDLQGFTVEPPLVTAIPTEVQQDEEGILSSPPSPPGAAAGLPPFPSQKVYMSRDKDDTGFEEEEVGLIDINEYGARFSSDSYSDEEQSASSEESGNLNGHKKVSLLLDRNTNDLNPQSQDSSSSSSTNVLELVQQGEGARAVSFEPQTQTQSQHQKLHCRVNVTMAVRVPGPLKMVPNALLGYAGSLILKAALSSILPSFLNLLVADYERWRSGERRKNEAVGQMFPTSSTAEKKEF